MRKKLLLTYLLIIAITIIVTVLFSWQRINDYFLNQVRDRSAIQIELLHNLLENKDEYETIDFQAFADKYSDEAKLRITIIDDNGQVLADSMHDPDEMENHKYRPEFKVALRGGEESSLRYSETVGMYFFYYAIPLKLSTISGALRISVPVDSIQALVWDMVQSVIIGLFIGVALSIGVAYIFTRRFMEPIDELTATAKRISSGDYDNKVYIDSRDQIGELAVAFNTMTYTMRKNLWDIEQKNAELESILTSMDTGLAAIDENYRIILCNEPFQDMFQLHGEVVGKLFYELTRQSTLFEVIEKAIDEDEHIVEETTYHRQGNEHMLKISASPIKSRTAKNTLHGILLMVEDITNLRKLERVRQEFVSNVTHELKTPLTSIKGFVDTLKNGAMDDQEVAIRFLDIIDIESDRLTLLIEDILALSEIETMRMDRNQKDEDLVKAVDEVLLMLEHKAMEKGIELNRKVSSDIPLYFCNRDRMKQLFINLIDNAIKYTEKGSVTVEMKLSRSEEHIVINVMDTGIGIEQEHLERLFERFYRVDKGRSRKMGGTGLGLSIVKHIIELYNGSIQVTSALNKGTTMKIKLPLRH